MTSLWDQNQLRFYNFFADPRIENTVRLIWQQENRPRIFTPKMLDHFNTFTGHRWMFVDLLIRHGILVPGVDMEALRQSVSEYRMPDQPAPPVQSTQSSPSAHLSCSSIPVPVPVTVIRGPIAPSIQASVGPVHARFPANWQQRIQLVGDNDMGGCQICCEYRADAMTQPCSHMLMCMECAKVALRNDGAKCPLCNVVVSQVLGVRLAS
jgi:hypothetical protein